MICHTIKGKLIQFYLEIIDKVIIATSGFTPFGHWKECFLDFSNYFLGIQLYNTNIIPTIF